MFSATSFFLCVTLLNSPVHVQCAVESPAADHVDFAATEWAIQNTLNNLFSTLKNKDMLQKPKLKQYTTIHNFFVSITLQDQDNLKEITRLTKVDNFDNGTRVFITQLNEVLDEDNKSDEETDAVYITSLIEEFLTKLDHLKESHGLKNNTKFFDINKAIIKYFEKNENGNEVVNTTYSTKRNANETYDNTTNSEFWDPLQLQESQSGRRIFGGRQIDIVHFPFVASVQFFGKFQCAGSIIKSDLVITSASCLQLAWNNRFFHENPAFLSLQAGSTYYEYGGENIPILEIHFHPNYNPKTLGHNLALLRMERALSFGEKTKRVKMIDIDRSPWPLPSNTDGITIVGWGARSLNSYVEHSHKNKLSYAVLEFYPLDECQEIYSREFVTRKNFCAGFFSKGGGACNRDAGGPGVVNGILAGVVSFGSPTCGAPDAPTVFTKLGFYTDWITEIMDKEVPSGYARTTLKPIKRSTIWHLPRPFNRWTPKLKITPVDQTSDESVVDKAPGIDDGTIRIGSKFKGFLTTIFDNAGLADSSSDEQQSSSEEATEIRDKKRKNKMKKKAKKKSKRKIKSSATKIRPLNLKPRKKLTTPMVNKIHKTSATKSVGEYDTIDSVETITLSYSPSESNDKDTADEQSDENIKNDDFYSDDNDDDSGSSEDQQKMEEAIEKLVDKLHLNEILGSDDSLFDDNERKNEKSVNTKSKHTETKTKVDTNPYLKDLTKKRVAGHSVESKDEIETDDVDESDEFDEEDNENDSENTSNVDQAITLDKANIKKKRIPNYDDNEYDEESSSIKTTKQVVFTGKKEKKLNKHDKEKKQKIAIKGKDGDILKVTKKIITEGDNNKEDESNNMYSLNIAKYLADLVSIVSNRKNQDDRKDTQKKGIAKKRKQNVQNKNIDNETTEVKEKPVSDTDIEDEDDIVDDVIDKNNKVISSEDAVLEDPTDKKRHLIKAKHKKETNKVYDDKTEVNKKSHLRNQVKKMKTTEAYSNSDSSYEDNNTNLKSKKKLVSSKKKKKLKSSQLQAELKQTRNKQNENDEQSSKNVENDNYDNMDTVTKKSKNKNKQIEVDDENDEGYSDADAEDAAEDNSNAELNIRTSLKEIKSKQKNNKKNGKRKITENLFKLIVGTDDILKLLIGKTA